jgi:D-xylose reductase
MSTDNSVQFARDNGIAVTAYASFGPQSFLELEWRKALDTPLLLEHPVIEKIAAAHGKTAAQILLRWSTQRDIAVIPKSNNPKRLEQNLSCCWFDMTQKEIEAIDALDKDLRFNDPGDMTPIRIFA